MPLLSPAASQWTPPSPMACKGSDTSVFALISSLPTRSSSFAACLSPFTCCLYLPMPDRACKGHKEHGCGGIELAGCTTLPATLFGPLFCANPGPFTRPGNPMGESGIPATIYTALWQGESQLVAAGMCTHCNYPLPPPASAPKGGGTHTSP